MKKKITPFCPSVFLKIKAAFFFVKWFFPLHPKVLKECTWKQMICFTWPNIDTVIQWIHLKQHLRIFKANLKIFADCNMCHMYRPIAFDERVTFWLQCAWSQPCACVCSTSCVCSCVMVVRMPTHNAKYTNTHKAVIGCVEAKKLLSRQRQKDYRKFKVWLNLYQFL